LPILASPDVKTPPPPPVIVEPPPPPPPELLWGRWQAVANLPADRAAVDKINAEANQNQALLGSYVIARPNNSSFVLPREGTASFRLTASEATLTKSGGEPMLANVENAHLDINFAARTYDTGLSVVNSLGRVDVESKGDVSLKGTLESPLFAPRFIVRGMLGGAKADEAVYIFKSTDIGDLTAAGITRWSK
jgi:hypothetical protein